jgi:hypothetical protein
MLPLWEQVVLLLLDAAAVGFGVYVGGLSLIEESPTRIEFWAGALFGVLGVAGGLAAGRYNPTGMAMAPGGILVQALLRGKPIAISPDRIRYARLSTARFRESVAVAMRCWSVVLENDHYPWGRRIPDWEGLVAALRAKLEPLGKWRE